MQSAGSFAPTISYHNLVDCISHDLFMLVVLFNWCFKPPRLMPVLLPYSVWCQWTASWARTMMRRKRVMPAAQQIPKSLTPPMSLSQWFGWRETLIIRKPWFFQPTIGVVPWVFADNPMTHQVQRCGNKRYEVPTWPKHLSYWRILVGVVNYRLSQSLELQTLLFYISFQPVTDHKMEHPIRYAQSNPTWIFVSWLLWW